jgi:toxin ParE1/3/4
VSPYRITPLAESDLENIGDHIAQDNPRRALSYVIELRSQCQKIAQAPWIYRARSELRDGLRSCAHGSHVIFFSADESSVLIIRILNGAQDVQALFGEQ